MPGGKAPWSGGNDFGFRIAEPGLIGHFGDPQSVETRHGLYQ